MNGEPMLRLCQVAARFQVSPKTIRSWTERGEFPLPCRVGPRLLRWREKDIEAFINSADDG